MNMKFDLIVEETLKNLSHGMTVDVIAKKHKVLPSIIKDQIKMGAPKEQKEHGVSLKKAQTIAMDHLMEDPKYYTKLSKIEKK